MHRSATGSPEPLQLAADPKLLTEFTRELVPDYQERFHDFWVEQRNVIAADQDSWGVLQKPTVEFRRGLRLMGDIGSTVLELDRREPASIKTLMIDADDTGANVRFGEGERIINPAIATVCDGLRAELGSHFSTGVLTSVKQYSIDLKIIPKLSAATSTVDPAMCISSRDHKLVDDPVLKEMAANEDWEVLFAITRPILDRRITTLGKLRRALMRHFPYEHKLPVLAKLVDSPEGTYRSFALADNSPEARVLSHDHSQIAGVFVERHMRFRLPDFPGV